MSEFEKNSIMSRKNIPNEIKQLLKDSVGPICTQQDRLLRPSTVSVVNRMESKPKKLVVGKENASTSSGLIKSPKKQLTIRVENLSGDRVREIQASVSKSVNTETEIEALKETVATCTKEIAELRDKISHLQVLVEASRLAVVEEDQIGAQNMNRDSTIDALNTVSN